MLIIAVLLWCNACIFFEEGIKVRRFNKMKLKRYFLYGQIGLDK